jgi:hypothetical protein
LNGDPLIPSVKIPNNGDERNDNIIPIFIIHDDDDDDNENGNDGNKTEIKENDYKGMINSIGTINDASKFLTEYLVSFIIYSDRCSGV